MKNNSAFTLIELLVVVAIIGLLASIVVVNVNSARDKAKVVKAVSFSQQLYRALGSDAVGVWDFNAITGGNQVADVSGSGNTGTVNGATLASSLLFSGGNLGNALNFDGVDDYVDCGNSASLNPTEEITISAWIKPAAYPVSNYIAVLAMRTEEYGSGWWGDVWNLYLQSDGKIYSRVISAAHDVDAIASAGTMTPGAWTYVAVTWKRNSAAGHKVYINGAVDKEQLAHDFPMQTLTRRTQIGGCPSPGAGAAPYDISFNGLIDEVRVYSDALSQSEIQKYYAESLPRHQLANK
jgi:prepilin-type N-terminal cleavage/methylation domain-containing protein